MQKQQVHTTPVIRLHGISNMSTKQSRKTSLESSNMDLLELPHYSVQTPPPGGRQSIHSPPLSGRTESPLPPSKADHDAIRSASRYLSRAEPSIRNQETNSRHPQLRKHPTSHSVAENRRNDFYEYCPQSIAWKTLPKFKHQDDVKYRETKSLKEGESVTESI
ncbi:uncharacterized protein LOC111088295 [Limulus polyphemus]|uniref:Uncharacterized protein LOC111088295 n=1 Tax=Limulus polyphemus TaxID=6850 RepID=A0ABM1TCU0_LIMPO|nr:uncharacterized protein LOC111088295 [Limulus polyphemus]XP_022253697.1 uncharacterized protein LOC111088295 [Limulus polyphemus]